MPVYILDRSHGPAVKDGRQRITLATSRTHEKSLHAALGQRVLIDLAKKGDKPRERVAEGACIFRARVVIAEAALVRLDAVEFHERSSHAADAERIERILRAAEQGAHGAGKRALDAVARLAGFRDWKRLWDHHSDSHRRGRPDADGRVVRELIGWA